MIGHLHLLWWWCLDYADDGCLSDATAEDIAEAAEWDGDATAFVGALVAAGFIEETADGWAVHDWWEYAGKLVERRKANAERMREARTKHEPDTAEPRETHVQRTLHARAGATVPNRTQPTEPTNQPESDAGAVAPRRKPPRSAAQAERDVLTEAVGRAWRPGKPWGELTVTEQKTCGRCSAELHRVRGSPEQIAAARAAWDASPKWREMTFTPDALKKHWGELTALASQNGTGYAPTSRHAEVERELQEALGPLSITRTVTGGHVRAAS